ncbi:MAG: hypothetical protein HY746_04835 [Elusimicrobia bacterium]|nr:hypothetical protein [Elusimicrobiota bacterium]
MDTKLLFTNIKPSKFSLQQKRARYYDVSDIITNSQFKVSQEELDFFENVDLIYRTLCAVLYNFAPTSGHPGGSISSGRIAQSLVFNTMDYDFSDPEREDNDLISYAAGHKAMGLYGLWALRNELVKHSNSKMPAEEKFQLRLEDLLGFRRNPSNQTPLFKKFHSKALDGHPTPATPFIKVATGASGVGVGATVGLALGAMDSYPANPPKVNMIEGEGGMTPGRVAEAMAAAATAQLYNLLMHVDWNQASIDSNQVCLENAKPGEYVQWTPDELAFLNDWNVIYVPNGHDFFQILTAQNFAYNSLENKQPTAIIYRTVKGWKYGIEGKSSHGAGHKFASGGYYATLYEFENKFNAGMPRYCSAKPTPESVEECFYETLTAVREVITKNPSLSETAGRKITESRERLDMQKRTLRHDVPDASRAYDIDCADIPAQLKFEPGREVTLRESLALSLNHINSMTGGAIIVSSADLYGSTSVNLINKGFGEGFYNAVSNPKSRILAAGGICEDAMGAIMSGLSGFGKHIGATSSYAAFIAALEHVPARLHAIGQHARRSLTGQSYNPFIIINAHAGIKTGEDGPTHADPQALQLLQENFPKGSIITLTPWEPQEIFSLMAAALGKRPCIIAPFVTRPPEKIIDREKTGLPPAHEAVKGIYPFLKADRRKKPYHGTVVIQGNGVAAIFANKILPELKKSGLNINVYYVASMELFDLLDEKEKEKIYPENLAMEAMGLTDFTLPTIYYWVRSNQGIKRTLHSFKKGRYLGSGKADDVLTEAGLDAQSQLKAITEYSKFIETLKS